MYNYIGRLEDFIHNIKIEFRKYKIRLSRYSEFSMDGDIKLVKNTPQQLKKIYFKIYMIYMLAVNLEFFDNGSYK